MVPSVVMALDELPRTPNGKVDRGALPSPEGERPELAGEFVPPRNEIEEALAAIVAELLEVDRVGAFDDFFDLGGHSLQGIRLVAQVRRRFGVEIELRRLFESPTIAGLSVAVAQKLVETADAAAVEAAFAGLGEGRPTASAAGSPDAVPMSSDVLNSSADSTT
jgi:acyl carrier protein